MYGMMAGSPRTGWREENIYCRSGRTLCAAVPRPMNTLGPTCTVPALAEQLAADHHICILVQGTLEEITGLIKNLSVKADRACLYRRS